ncbi:hypothetical protein K432DRAFT_377233 [Lepidopterella palustris CBS 459.81]|uniref:RING-type domain-containing protein n=1 Tax=Lepidopterella palustris CBS 459.81 TaxID=1314670 RepID=A0A8E2ELS9_9PEZI|nr:hypothetical protein K432DRAFT_377233 [Lepidopterella palustris CBS 459.81]
MSDNTTIPEPSAVSDHTSSSTAIAIVLPSLFAIVLVILIAIAFLLPRINPAESAESKEERRKKRMAKLDKSVKAQNFESWARRQSDEHPDVPVVRNPLCVICLEEIEDAAQIRGLGCLHVFHQQCLDDWFSRWNEYCPLCHRPILQCPKGQSAVQRPEDSASNLPVAAMV